MFLKFLYFTYCSHHSSFFFSDFPFYKEAFCFIIFSLCSNKLIHTFKKNEKKKMLILKFHPGMKCLHVFFLFFIPGWNFIPVFLKGMSSSRDEISSRQKRVNSKRHFTIDRDDFVSGRVSSRDEISRVNTLLNILVSSSFAYVSYPVVPSVRSFGSFLNLTFLTDNNMFFI